jgi:hypothetical protein
MRFSGGDRWFRIRDADPDVRTTGVRVASHRQLHGEPPALPPLHFTQTPAPALRTRLRGIGDAPVAVQAGANMKQQLKSRMWSGLVVALVIGLAAASTFAHDNDAMGHKDMMAAMDSNHDGMVSSSEHAAYMQQMFDKADSNHDGMLSKAEMDAAMKSMHGDHVKSDAMHNDHDADDMPAKK